jgi:hypothetical protein
MKKQQRRLQIDVLGAIKDNPNIIEMILSVDGRDSRCYISKDNYEALIGDGFFLRDGKEKDSAGCVNTTLIYLERNLEE